MILYNVCDLELYRNDNVTCYCAITDMHCSFCGERDSYASPNREYKTRSVLLIDGIHYVDNNKFLYITPQHYECRSMYEIYLTAPEI